MATSTSVEVIDLTNSPPPEPITIDDSDNELPLPEPDTLSPNKPKSRSKREKSRRASKQRKAALTESPHRVERAGMRDAKDGRRVEKREDKAPGRVKTSSAEQMKNKESEAQGGREEGEVEEEQGRSKKRERKHRSEEDEQPLEIADDQLFFIDTKPIPVPRVDENQTAGPSTNISPLTAPSKPDSDASKLLLPAHVTIWDLDFGVDSAAPVDIILPTEKDSDTESYIEHLDYDDRPAQRYFEEQKAEDSKPTSFVCKKCGVKNDHKTWECRTQICLTCGARDEHSTYGCPVSKVCFTCNMKGHLNRDCPNRAIAYSMAADKYHDCDRCGSQNHTTQECPTLWRQYVYVTDNERNDILRQREEMRALGLGKGGEGYIAGDDWCYNCGGANHLGDDCEVIRHPPDFPIEPSAFSSYNTLSGPFSDAPAQIERHRRELRDWENDTTIPDRWGFNAPNNVGRQAKDKNRARLAQRAQELEEDDGDDWFGNPRNARSRGVPPSAPSGPRDRSKSGGGRFGQGPAPAKKMTFGNFGQKQAEPSSSSRGRDYGRNMDDGRSRKPSLAERLQGDGELKIRGASSSSSKRKYDDRRKYERADRDRYAVPCACPPTQDVFNQHLQADVAAGHAVNNPSVATPFPTDGSVASQLARVNTALVSLQNLNGPGKGCPAVSTTLQAQQKALQQQL